MLKIENVREKLADGSAVIDIHVGDTTDLPVLNMEIGSLKVAVTSIACTKEGVWYKLHADGKWYKQDGSGDSVTPSEG